MSFYVAFCVTLTIFSGLSVGGLWGLIVSWVVATSIVAVSFFFTDEVAYPLVRWWVGAVALQTVCSAIWWALRLPAGLAAVLTHPSAQAVFTVNFLGVSLVAALMMSLLSISDNLVSSFLCASTVVGALSYVSYIAGVSSRSPFNPISLFQFPSQTQLAGWEIVLLGLM
ncbi:MAG: uncharacterized protein KVP18_000772 [Porospora cf. gigantea A]|uniref:uncharacterized protein n=1 Tax=Porospora cf. gigantea A TaxID=2853593 RepID=UPI00355A1C2F|nr:MAG: hypothetical protein KVP18_000772 [Porospora cf. gigantea A]